MEKQGRLAAGLMSPLMMAIVGIKPNRRFALKARMASLLVASLAWGLLPGGAKGRATSNGFEGQATAGGAETRTVSGECVAKAAGGGAGPVSIEDDQDSSRSEMRPLIERYIVDRTALFRAYPGSISPARHDRLRKLYSEWLDTLKKLNFDGMGLDARVDYVLFRNHLENQTRQLDIQASQMAEIEPLLPQSSVSRRGAERE